MGSRYASSPFPDQRGFLEPGHCQNSPPIYDDVEYLAVVEHRYIGRLTH